MASTRPNDSEATVRSVRYEREFVHLLRSAMANGDEDDIRDGLLDLLEMNGLRGNMIRRAIGVLRGELATCFGMYPRQAKRTLRICLRLIALHSTSELHLCECTVADVSMCLRVVVLENYERTFAEIIDNEYALPFIFDAIKTTRDPEYRNDVAWLASELLLMMPNEMRVTLVVRYYTQLPDIFMLCFGEKGDEKECNYFHLERREYAGIVATTPSLIVKLLAAVNDPDAPDPAKRDIAYDMSCDVLEYLLANTLAEPSLIQHVLGCGVLTAVVSYYARSSRRYTADRDTAAAAIIRSVLAAYPVWTREVKRIADSGTAVNAVVVMGKALPPRRPAGGILYIFNEEEMD